MSGFWESELGSVSGTAEDAYAKTFRQIPDGTLALAKIAKYSIDEYNKVRYFKIDWELTDGDFRGQHVFQKIKAIDADQNDKDPAKTRHRALNMMKLLYNMYDMKPVSAGMPDDRELARFHSKIAGIKIQLTEPNDQGKQYNWVSEIHPSTGFESETGVKTEVTYTPSLDSAFSRDKARRDAAAKDELDSDVPF